MSDWAMRVYNKSSEHMDEIPDGSIDALVTDPPAGIAFMGKTWDEPESWYGNNTPRARKNTPRYNTFVPGRREKFISTLTIVFRECLRVLKPGAHGLVWALPRTSHWTAMALEDAGFEVRDVITHLFGSGFPKSLDVSKAIDRAAGAEREVVGIHERSNYRKNGAGFHNLPSLPDEARGEIELTAPATDLAKQWNGWGTALKPASEHWLLVRKPLAEKSVAANVLKYGTGALNIEAARVAHASDADLQKHKIMVDRIRAKGGSFEDSWKNSSDLSGANEVTTAGRWPPNVILSHSQACVDDRCAPDCPAVLLDAQSGDLTSGMFAEGAHYEGSGYGGGWSGASTRTIGDTGGASRFFYVAKPASSEKDAGCEDLPTAGAGVGALRDGGRGRRSSNDHPTVKPVALMCYLCRMITPPGGIVLDPFAGSGTTCVAAEALGFRWVAYESAPEYIPIIKGRTRQMGLFSND